MLRALTRGLLAPLRLRGLRCAELGFNCCQPALHNEPHDLTWDTWAALAEGCADAIHAENPDWLIFVEGVGANPDNTPDWWGGALKGAEKAQPRAEMNINEAIRREPILGALLDEFNGEIR